MFLLRSVEQDSGYHLRRTLHNIAGVVDRVTSNGQPIPSIFIQNAAQSDCLVVQVTKVSQCAPPSGSEALLKAAKCPDTLPLLSVRYLYGTSAGNLVSDLAAVSAGLNSFNPDAAPVQFEEKAEVVRVVARYLEDAQNRLSRAYVKEQKAKGLPDKWQLSIMRCGFIGPLI